MPERRLRIAQHRAAVRRRRHPAVVLPARRTVREAERLAAFGADVTPGVAASVARRQLYSMLRSRRQWGPIGDL